MGAKYFNYAVSNNNCQDFCVGLLRANDINADSVISFIKQDTENIFKNHVGLRKFVNTVTDLAGKVIDPIVQGGGFDKLTRKQLIDLIKKWKKVNVVAHSGLKKSELISYLNAHFDVVDGVLHLKSKTVKKRTTPTLVSVPSKPGNISSGLTKGQKSYQAVLDKIEKNAVYNDALDAKC
jgi:hypothetical protein